MTPPALHDRADVLAVFEELVELDVEAREARLAAIGSANSELRQALQELLAADAMVDTLLAHIDSSIGLTGDSGRSNADPLSLVGRTVSHFRILEPLGYGGMGVVYRAEDTQLKRPAALKFPLTTHHLDPSVTQRFLHEARVVAALDHPNLCQIYETGQTADGHLFHAMPLYEGETLKARLAREGRLPLADAVHVATQIVQGLGAAHHAGIVHRDLKPGNVMLLSNGAVKILDFGLAKGSDISLTGPWTRLGTVSYMAPEQIHGRKLDGRTDLWALGVVLFEMLTGRRPFAGENEISVAHAILHEEPVRASTLRGELTADLDELVRTLLRKDPAKRYQSAEDVTNALTRIRLEGGPGAAAVHWRRRRLGTWLRRVSWRKALVASSTIVVIIWSSWLGHRTTTAPARPRALAVLPFKEHGGDESQYLAAGLADGIRTDLARLGSLIVPSYVTTSRYDSATKSLSWIASELEVSTLLLGRVERLGERVRVDAQLLDAKGEKQLWTQHFERPVSEILDIQREATRATVAALGIRPTAAERALLERPVTARAQAYDTYLRGRAIELAGLPRELFASMPTENIRQAQSLYSRARDLDPDFAIARARLALMHTRSAMTYDTTEARREQARLEAEAALRLRPGLAEAHEALANYWDSRGEPAKAIDESKRALQGSPNSGDLRRSLGGRYARAGRLEEAAAEFKKAMQLEPGSPNAAFLAAIYYLRLRRDEEAMQAFDRAIALKPDYHMVKVIKGHTYLRWKGIPDTLAAAMRTIPAEWDPDGMATYARYTALRAQRRYADALGMIDESRSELSQDGFVYQPRPLLRAQLQEALGERAKARANYAAARAVLLDSVNAHPDDASIRIALGLALAGLGYKAEAVRQARRAMALVPVATNTPAATAFMGGAVEVFAKAGEIGAAMELLELLFSMPAGREVTIGFLRVWPGFDPLRKDPRFEQLLERYATR